MCSDAAPRMTKRGLWNSDSAVAAILAAGGVAVAIGSVSLGFGALAQPGAGLFPFFAGVMICAGALVTLAGFARHAPVTAEAEEEEPGGTGTLAALLAIFALWILIMPFTGFVIGTLLCVFAFAKIFKLEGWVKPLLLSVATSLVVYLMFDRLLQLDLPPSPWG
jgi:putative tricarboxylic transport membrane protein